MVEILQKTAAASNAANKKTLMVLAILYLASLILYGIFIHSYAPSEHEHLGYVNASVILVFDVV